MVVSGQGGAARYQPAAQQVAELGSDAILVDGNDMEGSHGQALKTVVQQARNAAHGQPGKVGVVGFSLGGGESPAYASRWTDPVSVVVWYPATSGIHDPAALVRGIKVPVPMFAGESDTDKSGCLIGTARTLEAAARRLAVALSGGRPQQAVLWARQAMEDAARELGPTW